MDRKCYWCNRKCYLTVKCHCEKVFCIEHRDPDDHECTFDFKQHDKDVITKQNPKVVSKKIEVL